VRRLTQFVAILVVVCFAAVQPAMGGLSCAARMHAACAPGCPMTMSGMGADCPMASQMAANSCAQNCCAQAQPQAVVLPAAVKELHLAVLASPAAFSAETCASGPDFARRAAVAAESDTPPLYLLNQVFRI
jgi:hypothetical protein